MLVRIKHGFFNHRVRGVFEEFTEFLSVLLCVPSVGLKYWIASALRPRYDERKGSLF